MGIAHILYVYEDGLNCYDQQKTEEAVGAAVMAVCLNPEKTYSGINPLKPRVAPVLGAGNCVNRAAEVHSTDEQIFVWARNCLRTLDQLRDEEVESAKQLFDALYEERRRHA